MPVTPTLEARRILLRPYTPDLVSQRHVDWLNNPVVTRYSEQRHYQHTMQSQIYHVEHKPQDSRFWLITHKPESALSDIGTIFAHIDRFNGIGEIGLLVGETSVWGKGYGFEAWNCVMDYLFSDGIRKIEAGCMEGNLAMEAIFQRSRMLFEGRRPNHFIWTNGSTRDLIQYGRLAR